jgi:hypothetical protein
VRPIPDDVAVEYRVIQTGSHASPSMIVDLDAFR